MPGKLKYHRIRGMLALMAAVFLLVFSIPCASGEISGTMRVVNCREWVSLREKPDQKSMRLMTVPLGERVFQCEPADNDFVYCRYMGVYGYILRKYLKPDNTDQQADEESNGLMTLRDLTSGGRLMLDWNEYNVRVVARYDAGEDSELLRIGCFVDEEPVWSRSFQNTDAGQYQALKAFMGGTARDPQVMVYNGSSGLTMLDLLTGREIWNLSSETCPLGNAAAIAVGDDGIMYIAGTDGPPPTAVSASGRMLWQMTFHHEDIYWPYSIELGMDEILVRYESGYQISLDYSGVLIGFMKLNQ